MTRHLRCEDVPGHPDFRPLSSIDGIAVDLRYAGCNNVFGLDVYAGLDCAWLHADAAAALAQAVRWLRTHAPAERLLVLDGLRPQRAQRRLWHELPDPALRAYLADPAIGSIHSFGLALDVTLQGPDGAEVDMGTGFDAMTELSHPANEPRALAAGLLQPAQVAARVRLRAAMGAGGFHGIDNEWWHFDLHDRAQTRATGLRVE
jgi:D-alanyl-D-alanine dipeptidase